MHGRTLYNLEEAWPLSMQMMTFARRGPLEPVAVARQTLRRSSQAPEGVSHQNLLLSWQLPVQQHTHMHVRFSSCLGAACCKQAHEIPMSRGLSGRSAQAAAVA